MAIAYDYRSTCMYMYIKKVGIGGKMIFLMTSEFCTTLYFTCNVLCKK